MAAFAAMLLISAAQAAIPVRLHTATDRPAPAPVAKTVAVEPLSLIAFAEPVAGYPVVSPFGLRQMPWEKHGRLHEGVDIAAPAGLPITASADGIVTRAGQSPTYGRFVEIQHVEGLVSFYAHMGAIDPAVVSGVAVKSGTRIGAVGNSGTSTGSHLHFELRDARDRPLDPQAFVGKRFASAEELPISEAARVSSRVRMAYVSRIPANKRDLMEAKADKKKGGRAEVQDAPQAAPGSWMQAKLDDRERVRAQIRFIAAEQHKEAAASSSPAPSAPDTASPVVPVAPLKVTPPPLQLPS